MSPIDVESTTIGFPFPAAGAAPEIPANTASAPSSVIHHHRFIILGLSFHTAFDPATGASVALVVMPGWRGQRHRRERAREVAPDLDAAAVVHAGHEAPPAHLRVHDDVALGVERE